MSAKAESEVLRKEINELCDREPWMAARVDKAGKVFAKASASGFGVRDLSRDILTSSSHKTV